MASVIGCRRVPLPPARTMPRIAALQVSEGASSSRSTHTGRDSPTRKRKSKTAANFVVSSRDALGASCESVLEIAQPRPAAILVGKHGVAAPRPARRWRDRDRPRRVRDRGRPNRSRRPCRALRRLRLSVQKPWAKPTGTSNCAQLSAESSTATWRPKVGEELRRSTATSRMRPRATRTSLSCAMRRDLEMQPADRAGGGGKRMVVLHEIQTSRPAARHRPSL